MKPLTPKQKAFVDFYLETLNATEAAIRAGYSEKTAKVIGCENLTKPYIRSYIDERMKEKENDRIAKQDEILELLTRIARGEVEEEFAIGVGNGEQRLERKEVSPKDRLKAVELLGKRYGMWTDKQIIDATQQVIFADDLDD